MIYLLLGTLASNSCSTAFKLENMRMHLSTRTICHKGVKDVHGNPAPCGKSMAMETYGLTLPGMEDGSVTTREDMIITRDGGVTVKAMPSRPYQFLMTVESPQMTRVDQLFKNQALTIQESRQESQLRRTTGTANAPTSLTETGWTYKGTTTLDGSTVHKYTRTGPQGVDPVSQANYTALYQTGMIPDEWDLYTDSNDENPVKLVATNSFTSTVLQETVYSNHEKVSDDMDVAQAEQEMFSTYQITGRRRLGEEGIDAPPVNTKYLTAAFIAEDERNYFEDADNINWLEPRRLRAGMSAAAAGVMYFDIADGSAADVFFHTEYNRRMVELIKFEYPKNCRHEDAGDADREQTLNQTFCLWVAADATIESFTLSAGIVFFDVNDDATDSAYLRLTVEVLKSEEYLVANLTLEAGGCATTWKLGAEDISLTVIVCIQGSVSQSGDSGGHNETFVAKASVTATFNINLPQLNTIKWSIKGSIKCVAEKNADIKFWGRLEASVPVILVGVDVSVDITGNTMDNLTNKWEFFSGVNLRAWIDIIVYKHSWEWRWEIWHASPVYF